MPFRKRFQSWKDRVKHKLGLSSANASTNSLPNMGQTSPSPPPQPITRMDTPLAQSHIPSAHIQSPTDALSPATAPVPDHSIAASPASSPHVVINAQPPASADPLPSLDKTDVTSGQESGLERAKTTAWAGLKTLLKVLESSADAFGPLKSAIGGLNQCIDIYERAAKGREDYNELRTKLDSLLEDLNPLLGGQIPPTMITSIENICNGIQKELELVEGKQDRGTTRRYAEAMSDSELVLECYRRIYGYIERLTLNAELNIWKIVCEQATDARLDRLSPSHAAVYDSSKSSIIERGPCTSGTRKEELIQLQGWASNVDGSDIYWMNGMAGTGKTTIAYSLCEVLKETKKLGASFFCSRSIPECRKVELILPSIAYQLARFSHPFRYALSRILESDSDAHHRSLDKQFNILISKPLLEIKDSMSSAVTVVIDALDECENENTVGQILEVLLAGGRASKLPVRFLVSSRPEPAIYPRMMKQVGSDLSARLVLHELATATVKGDIRTYLSSELEGVPLTSEQLAALVERSGVLFIYASTAARYVKDGLQFKEHEERLNMILGLLPPSADGQDRDIDTLYASILNAVFTKKRLNESVRTRMKAILHTVVCAQEPMSLGGLAALLSLKDSEQVDALLRPLSSVVKIGEMDGLVTILHASFPDFMFDQERSSIFCCEPTVTHGLITKACFTIIAKNNPQFNLCQMKSSYLRDNQDMDLPGRADQAVSSELFYACRYWVAHLELSDQHQDLGKLLYDFLSVRLLLWMEVLTAKGSIHLGARIIQRAENLSRTNACSEEISELAHDAWRFVTMFAGHAVSQSTPHIYISMLPFWPESGPIAKLYKKRIRGAIEVQGTAMKRRQLALLATWPFDHAVQSACFSPDGSLIAFRAASSIYVIDGTTGRAVVAPLQHNASITSVAFSPNGALIASGSEDNMLRIWDVQNGHIAIGPITGHTEAVRSVSFSPDGTRIVSSSNANTIRVWDLQTGDAVLGPLECQGSTGESVRFSPDGTRIISSTLDNTLRAWDAYSGLMVTDPVEGHRQHVSCLCRCLSPDNTRIATGSIEDDDYPIQIWNAEDGQMVGDRLEGHSRYVVSVAFSPDGRHIVSASYDKTIRLWDLTSDPISSRILEGHTGPVTSVAFSSDGSRIVSCSHDNTIRVWDTRSRATVADSLEGHTGAVYSVGYSPDGKHIVSGSGDKTIRMWDAESGQMVGGPLEGHTGRVRSVCFSPDGRRIVSSSDDETIRAWDVQSGQTVVGPLERHTNLVLSICLSPDGALIASGSGDETIRVWDAQDGKPVGNSLEGHNTVVRSVCFSPDSVRIASGSDDKTIMVWDAKSGRNVAGPLEGHTNWVLSVCFSPDGTCLVSGSEDKAVRVWDAQGGQTILGPLEGHTGGINSICFSPSGTLIVSGSDDKTVRLWDARSGQAVGDPLIGHTGPVWSVAFSPDGKHIVSGSEDQTIRVWDVDGILRMYGAADSLPSPSPGPISPPRPHESWVLREDGWVVDPEDRLLAWVPPDLHIPLLRAHNTLRISAEGYLKLNFDSAHLGESWAECYQLPSS